MVIYSSRISLLVLVLFCAPVGAAQVDVNCPTNSLQAAINAAVVDTAINITGTCQENILVDNDRIKLYLIGSSPNRGAIISGSNSSKHVFDVRGKGILIQNLTITGGRNGITVQRGSNAVIVNNRIHFVGNHGINVSQLAFAVITLNTIENNPKDGIQVTEGASARIGFNHNNDANAGPNTIQGNDRGIVVANSSHASVAANFINNNTLDGIVVTRNSQVDAATNTINGNGQDGISVSDNAMVTLGEDNPRTPGTPGAFGDQPNTTTVNNARNGIRCVRGGVVRGHLGASNQLNGTVSQFGGGNPNEFSSTCANSATNLVVP